MMSALETAIDRRSGRRPAGFCHESLPLTASKEVTSPTTPSDVTVRI
jgi:hypothetical protein